MDIMAILLGALASFGAGTLAAAMGAVNAFIMTGVIAIIGGIAQCLGLTDGLTGIVAFGTIFGPHLSFAAGAAAAGYAKRIGKLQNGCNLGLGLASLGEPKVLAVGGIFGIIGWAIGTFVVPFIFNGINACGIVTKGLIPIGTDNPGMTVVISGVIARLAFGKRGLLSAKPSLLSKGKDLGNVILRAVGYSLMVAGTGIALADAGVSLAGYNIIIFGCAAVSLIFAGNASWHHTGIISAYATMVAIGAGLPDLGVVAMAVGCGLGAGLLCNFENCLINSDVDSHIDGEGFSICLMTIVVNIIAKCL
jgi:hypothetical protein